MAPCSGAPKRRMRRPLWCGCPELFAAAAVADRHQLLRLCRQRAAVAAFAEVLRTVALGRLTAGVAQDVEAGIELQRVGGVHLVVECAPRRERQTSSSAS